MDVKVEIFSNSYQDYGPFKAIYRFSSQVAWSMNLMAFHFLWKMIAHWVTAFLG